VIAFGIYEECLLEKEAQHFWKFDEEEVKQAKRQALSFFQFREKLSLQVLTYSPVNQFYPGDKNFREVTQMSIERRKGQRKKRSADKIPVSNTDTITSEQYVRGNSKETENTHIALLWRLVEAETTHRFKADSWLQA
jgi:xylose isomerase